VTAKVSADADELKWLALLKTPLEKIFVSESIKAVEGFFKHTGGKLAEYVRLRDSVSLLLQSQGQRFACWRSLSGLISITQAT
jgi:hypothetical protein